MNQPLRRYMRPGLIQFMAYPQDRDNDALVQSVRRIAQDTYFSVIELTHVGSTAARREVRAILDTAGMDVYFGAQPMVLASGLNPNDVDEAGRRAAERLLLSAVDEAADLGARGFAFLSGRWQEDSREKALDALVRTTLAVCRRAREQGVPRVALEVFDYDVDKCSLVGPAGLALAYARAVRQETDNFGLMVDLSHLPLLRESPEEALLPVRDYIIHAHLGNAVVTPGLPAYGDAHPRFGFPGSVNGVREVMAFLRTLLDIGFLNPEAPPPVSFEVKPWEGEDPDLVVAGAKRVLNEAWAGL